MNKRWVIVVLLLAAAGALLLPTAGCASKEAESVLYHCPMHPTYTSERPGTCPICGMDLVNIGKDDGVSASAEKAPPGYATIKLSSERRQKIGLRTEPARREPLTKSIRTVGIVRYDETRIHHMHLKISGYVEHAHVTYVGQPVRRGEPLFTLYSPEVYAAAQEYVLALKTTESMSGEAARGAREILDATRRRLELWNIGAEEIARLEMERAARRTMTFHAPVSGFIYALNVRHGMFVTPETELFAFADLSRVWVEADLYESEIGLVREGQHAALTVDAYPGETVEGRVAYIYPFLDPATRTNRARFEFANPGLRLKPDMYANVSLDVPLGEFTTVPREAVLDTGERKIVFVAGADDHFVPREIRAGHEAGGRIAVLDGVAEGALVVVSGTFLLDSESRIRASVAPPAPAHAAISDGYPVDFCVVGGEKLGSMGDPYEFEHEGKKVVLCCKGCLKTFKENPAEYLKAIDDAAAKAGAP